MSRSSTRIFLDEASAEPIYLQIVAAIVRDVERGRLKAGEALPGYRALAQELGVNRNTVLAAFHELAAQGWVVSKPGEGSTIAESLPSRLGAVSGVGYPAAAATAQTAAVTRQTAGKAEAAVMQAGSGVPDPRLLPTAALGRAYREAARNVQRAKGASEEPQGHPRLRAALGKLLSDLRGIDADPARLFITRGGASAMTLVARALATVTGAVAVETPGAPTAWSALAQAGVELVPVAVDEHGLDVTALAALAAKKKFSAVLVTPHRHYPTLAPLAEARRRQLLELARTKNFYLIESDPDPEFHFDGALRPALASEEPERVIYLGTLSRVFSPGVRLGHIRAPAALAAKFRELRAGLDESDVLLELAMAGLIEDGELQRHVNRTRKIYQGRRDALAAALTRKLPETITFALPPGGLALWLKADPSIDVDAWAARAKERGAVFRPGSEFTFDRKPLAALRLGFSSHSESELEELASRIERSLPPEKRR